jgi:hypothetical protein
MFESHTLPVSKKIRDFAERHGMKYHWCGKNVRLDVACMHPLAPTKEHLIPKALKGRGQPEQVVLAHGICNGIRGVADMHAYRRLMDGEAVTKYELWPHIFKLL